MPKAREKEANLMLGGNVKMSQPAGDAETSSAQKDNVPQASLSMGGLDGSKRVKTSLSGEQNEIRTKSARISDWPPKEYCDAAGAVRAAYVEAIKHTAPTLGRLFELLAPEILEKPLRERSTDELIIQIDAGRFTIEIARLWSVSAHELNRWIASDSERVSRVSEARKNQAALWDWVALQVLLHAPSERVEIMRAEKIAHHCRWRAEAFSREEYGRVIKSTQVDDPNARELTTRELEVIARGGLLPG
jgi:hypothetical protein